MDLDELSLVEARIKELTSTDSPDCDLILDFESLYPSIQEKYNIYPHTVVPPHLDDVIPDEECHIIETCGLRMRFYQGKDSLASCVIRQAKAGNPKAKQFLRTIR